jgi:Domain of unknown function (DUF4294)
MKWISLLLFIFLFSISGNAQIIEKDSTKMGYVLKESDTISDPIELEEIIVYKEHLDPEAKKQFLLLQNRVYKVYPYAKVAAERLVVLNKNMSVLTTNRDKKKYFKIAEEYMNNEFEAKLKKLSRKQGQILVKLIYRQTGISTFDLIKELKSGWKAFWSNSTARLFDINLKTKYAPYEVNEDYLIETILYRAFNRGRLIKQESATPVDYDELSDYWEKKAKEFK